MGMTCRTCIHAKRADIERAMIAGRPLLEIEREFGVSDDSLAYHRSCIGERLLKADALSGRRVLTSASRLVDRLESMADDAHNEKERVAFLLVARELRPTLQLLGSVNGEIMSASMREFMAAIGAQSETEIRSALQTTRQAVTVDELFAESLESLRFVLAERPELRAVALAAIGREASSAEVLPGTNGHHEHGNGATHD